MATLDKIKAPIKEEMQKFEPFFNNQLKSKIPLLSIITNYVLRRKGKQMRPMLVFLSSKLNGETNETSYVAASLIEILHTATLIHDDVVDETYQRRGFFSINALWKSKVAVLVGDFFLSRGLLTALEYDQFEMLKVTSEAIKEMSEGELLQIEKSRKLDITEEVYFDIIRKKTATLIGACAAIGCLAANKDQEKISLMKQFGETLGIAFQIRDDLFDYEKTSLIGKPTGNDIKEKKMTLPLIHVLNSCSKSDKRKIINTVKRHHKNDKKVTEVIDFVKENGGIEYAYEKMMQYKNDALQLLEQYPDSEAKESLIELVNYTIQRKK